MKKFKLLLAVMVVGGLFVASCLATPALADRMTSDSYIITFGNFNVSSGETTDGSNYTVTNTVGQLANGPYGEYGSTASFVGSGFQYIYQIDTFSFQISSVSVALGELTAGVHSTGSNDLTVTTKGAGGYTVYAYEEHPLRRIGSVVDTDIQDTSCDAGDCTISTASPWINQSIAGFGFNMSGDDVATDFIDSTYFRPFANKADGDLMQAVMSSDNVASSRVSTVTYKAGISATQAAGNYETYVVFIAVPGY